MFQYYKMVECPEGKEVSWRTKKCINKCREDQVRHPKTNRCRKVAKSQATSSSRSASPPRSSSASRVVASRPASRPVSRPVSRPASRPASASTTSAASSRDAYLRDRFPSRPASATASKKSTVRTAYTAESQSFRTPDTPVTAMRKLQQELDECNLSEKKNMQLMKEMNNRFLDYVRANQTLDTRLRRCHKEVDRYQKAEQDALKDKSPSNRGWW